MTVRPKVLKGAFIEYGLSLPPLLFAFQFNPKELSRSRTSSGGGQEGVGAGEASCLHEGSESQERSRLSRVRVSPETISLTLTLDAKDELNDGETLAEQFGVGARLSLLELLMYPKTDQLFGIPVGTLLGNEDQFGTSVAATIPILLFVWGRKRVIPCVINSMQITEQEFFPDLNPSRAEVAVTLEVLEGFNPPYLYYHGWRVALGAMNLGNIADFADVL